MATPSSSLATLRPDLMGSLEEFDLEMDRAKYIGLRVAPVVNVARSGGSFGIIPIEQLLQSPDTKRAPGSAYKRGNFTFTTATFATEEHGWEEPIDDNDRNNFADYLDVELVATQRARSFVAKSLEERVAAAVFNTSTWTGASLTTAVGTPWSTIATATPLVDVEAAVLKVYENSGLWPNSLILSRKAFRYLRNCASIVDRVKYSGFMDTRAGEINEAALAQCFDLENIIVAGGTQNTANQGQTAALSSIWDSTMAMVCVIDGSTDLRRPTLARTFHWAEDGSQIAGTIETYRDETIRGDVVRVRNQTHEKIITPEVGHLLTSVTA